MEREPHQELTPDEPDEEAKLESLRQKLMPYYHRYRMHVARVDDPASPSHPDRLREIGRRARLLRRLTGLSRTEVAQRTENDPILLAAFEGGLVPPDDLPEGFGQNLSTFLEGELRSRGVEIDNLPAK